MKDNKQNLIILSKLQEPQLKTKTLRRERLLNLLLANLNKKVILLCAGAGYGKTTLISQFLSDTNISYVYYHLEKSDAEPAVFFSYLIGGIRKISPEFGYKTEGLRHFFNYPLRYLEIIVGTFINEIIECLNTDLFIILDDYHWLNSSEIIARILDYLLDHLPQNLHFIITSRTTPERTFSKLRARDEIFELDSQQLRFTKTEIEQLFKTLYTISLKETELTWLETNSEGWPTGLRLMLQSCDYGTKLSSCMSAIKEIFYKTRTNFFNYFAQEIYNCESPRIKQFLADCSILEWLTPELCNAVTQRKDSANILSDLNNRNAFISTTANFGYRFHTLFRDFLSSKLTDKNRIKQLNRQAGDFYYKNNMYEDAVRFYLQAQDYRIAASIIEKIGADLINQGKSTALCSYIEKIPDLIQSQYPKLLLYYGQSLTYTGSFDESEKIYHKAAKILKSQKRKLEYAWVLSALGLLNLEQSNWGKAKNWFKKASTICPKGSTLIRANILSSLGLIYTHGRDFFNASQCYQEAYEIAYKKSDKNLEASILNNWAMNEWSCGNLNSACSKILMMVDILKERFDVNCGSGFYNAARISLLMGEEDNARTILDCGLNTCGPYNDLYSIAEIWRGYALLYQELGDIKNAKDYIIKALEVYKKIGIVRLRVAALHTMCNINIAARDFLCAERNLSEIWSLKKCRDDIEAIVIFLTEAKLKIVQGKFNIAEDILLKALKITKKFQQIFDLFLIYLELGKVFYNQRKLEKTALVLKDAVKLSQIKGYDKLMLKALMEERWMLEFLRKENIGREYVNSIIRGTPLDIHKIEAFLFGVPKIFIDGVIIKDSAWKLVKAKKLFFYLLLNKDRQPSNDLLIEVFWPDATYKGGRYNLRTTVHHIRKAFESSIHDIGDVIDSSWGFYQVSGKVIVSFDAEEFQSLTNLAKRLTKNDEKLELYLKKALSIYKEGFATGWYDDWVEDMRHYHKGLYEDCLSMMADLHIARRKYQEAFLFYKKLVSLNFYNEEYHRKLMVCYAKLHKYKEIKITFAKLKRVLKKELGAEPKKETIDLYLSLIK